MSYMDEFKEKMELIRWWAKLPPDQSNLKSLPSPEEAYSKVFFTLNLIWAPGTLEWLRGAEPQTYRLIQEIEANVADRWKECQKYGDLTLDSLSTPSILNFLGVLQTYYELHWAALKMYQQEKSIEQRISSPQGQIRNP